MRNRILAAAAALIVFGFGLNMSGAVPGESAARVEEIRDREVSAQDAQALALARDLNFKKQAGYFEAELEADFKAFGISPIPVDQLRQPNRFVNAIEKPVTLSPGKLWNSEHLRIKASIERVAYQRSGATVHAKHSVATVTNVSAVPVAYFVQVRSAKRGHCKVRGARMHNAMALMPGESAEVVVCGGTGAIEIEQAKVLEVSPIGAIYVSKLPPFAVGHDAITSRAHQPLNKVDVCSQVPATRIANLLKTGEATWAAVVDFYSRHSCERFQFHSGYELATEPVETLPAVEGAKAPKAG